MQLSLPPDIAQIVQDQIDSGKYNSIEEVVAAGVRLLEQQDIYRDLMQRSPFTTYSLNRLLNSGL
jgi:putative addiction module CopG family antidote